MAIEQTRRVYRAYVRNRVTSTSGDPATVPIRAGPSEGAITWMRILLMTMPFRAVRS